MGKTVYDIIKKQNGEGFARVLRDKNVLEIPNVNVATVVRYAGNTPDDAMAIVPYLWSLRQFREQHVDSTRDPFELLHRAGYEFVEYADTLEKQNAIKKYFRAGEELCTFDDETRYQNYYIINAVKYNAQNIKPAKKPERQDEYGTSVISIQLLKHGNFISIKNRYNHSVNNPDDTFHSNPDEIIAGLSAALKGYFNIDWRGTNPHIPNGFAQIDNKLIKYNYEVNNTYFGFDFYEKHGQIFPLDKDSQIMMDYFIWDSQEKRLINPSGIYDSFRSVLNAELDGKNVSIVGHVPNYRLVADGIEIAQIENGKIVSLTLPDTTEISDNFLPFNYSLRTINLPQVKYIGHQFLTYNKGLVNINAPQLQEVKGGFLNSNFEMTKLSLPNLRGAGYGFLQVNDVLTDVDLPMLECVGDMFLYNAHHIEKVDFPNLKFVGTDFMRRDYAAKYVNLPNVVSVGANFMQYAREISTLKMNTDLLDPDFVAALPMSRRNKLRAGAGRIKETKSVPPIILNKKAGRE